MPRKGNVPKREVLPDPIYGNVVVAKLINSIMLNGKKGVAQSIVYGAFERIAETGQEPIEVFEKALSNIMPIVEVKARRVGGANYQVPVEVRPDRRQTLGLRWLTKYTRLRGAVSAASARAVACGCHHACAARAAPSPNDARAPACGTQVPYR